MEVTIKQALISGGYVSEKNFLQAEKEVGKAEQAQVDWLLSHDFLSEDLLGQSVAEAYGIKYADLNSNVPSDKQIKKIPEKIAKQFRVVLFKEALDGLKFATDRPQQAGLAEALKSVFPKAPQAEVMYGLSKDIDELLLKYRKHLATRFEKIIEEETQTAPKLIDEILKDALTLKASDIHMEPQAEDVLVRFRVDDVLQVAGKIPKKHYETVLNRIKVMANLRTDEHLGTQDGAIRYKFDEEEVDLRVSIAPVVDGEKIALRILSRYVKGFSLSNLGLNSRDQKRLEKSARLPFGMILVTGPTGSGKTTTLYSVVKILNTPETNITTIEDPVEYKIAGVNHIQVNESTDLTFAKGLRSIVRQDPNIILVGEIRDEETADIAVNAALTGHLLLSTFHANDAATTIPRLLDMGVEPFLLASTLDVVLAQRLVRKICENCRVSVEMSSQQLEEQLEAHTKWFGEKKVTLYQGKGCPVCSETGYKGRMAIFELIAVDQAMEQIILTNPSAQEVWSVARNSGTRSMFEDGIEKVKQGITTLDEVLRVAQIPVDATTNAQSN